VKVEVPGRSWHNTRHKTYNFRSPNHDWDSRDLNALSHLPKNFPPWIRGTLSASILSITSMYRRDWTRTEHFLVGRWDDESIEQPRSSGNESDALLHSIAISSSSLWLRTTLTSFNRVLGRVPRRKTIRCFVSSNWFDRVERKFDDGENEFEWRETDESERERERDETRAL
jgi:hypothetical protein